MDFVSGRLYFIKDEFFEIVGEEYLKMNKDDTQRPHYYAFKDSSTNLLWVIPCSRQVDKYKAIIENKKKNGISLWKYERKFKRITSPSKSTKYQFIY